MADEDHFSPLNDDCLLAVFSFLNRDRLDMMTEVSSRMHSIAMHEECRKVKKTWATLNMAQYFLGYYFSLEPSAKDEDSLLCVMKTEPDGTYFSSREEVRRLRQQGLADAPVLIKQVQTIDHFEFEGLDERLSKPALFPERMLQPLRPLLQRSSFQRVIIRGALIDKTFLRFYRDFFKEKAPESLRFSSCTFAKGLSAERLSSFILDLGCRSLALYDVHYSHLDAIAWQPLLKEFGRKSQFDGRVSLEVSDLFLGLRLKEWEPTAEILEVLPRFKSLSMPSMILRREWIFDLILTRLRGPRCATSWKFSMRLSVPLYSSTPPKHFLEACKIRDPYGEPQGPVKFITLKCRPDFRCQIETYFYSDRSSSTELHFYGEEDVAKYYAIEMMMKMKMTMKSRLITIDDLE